MPRGVLSLQIDFCHRQDTFQEKVERSPVAQLSVPINILQLERVTQTYDQGGYPTEYEPGLLT